MQQAPHALIAMSNEAFQAQFDESRVSRIANQTTLLTPKPVCDLDTYDASALEQVEVLFTSWGSQKLTGERLARLPNLKAVFHCAGSIKGITSPEFWDRNISITTSAAANAVPVAEYTFAAIINAGKRVSYFSRHPGNHNATWDTLLGSQLSNYGRTIGIVGLSRIGRRTVEFVAQMGDVTCLVFDPMVDADTIAKVGAHKVELDELLKRSDVVSLHAPSLESTRHMIAARELALMRDGATLINTARGALVDTEALISECATGRLDAILDVTEPEPLPAGHPLFDMPNVAITPHVAGALGTETLRLTDAAIAEMERYLTGRPLLDQLHVEDMRNSA